jgi:predicted dehydrogenase
MKILVIGLGSVGSRHLSNLISLGYKDIILYRTQKSVMKDINKFSSLPAYHDINDALAQKPDVAIIANPTSLHVEVALKCAKAGCNLFIEKPVSHNLVHLQELHSLVKKKGLITFIGCQFRFHPHLQTIKYWVKNKALGRVIYASARWAEYLPDWHPWEDYRKGYSALKRLGGGVILTLIHPIDYMYWLFGGVSRVTCIHDRLPGLKTDVENIAEITLGFNNKVIGHVHVDYFQKPRVHDLLIVAEKRRIYWNCHEGILISESRNGKKYIRRNPRGFERNGMFISELKHFLYCIKKRKQTLIPLKEGIEVLRIALEAAEKGK